MNSEQSSYTRFIVPVSFIPLNVNKHCPFILKLQVTSLLNPSKWRQIFVILQSHIFHKYQALTNKQTNPSPQPPSVPGGQHHHQQQKQPKTKQGKKPYILILTCPAYCPNFFRRPEASPARHLAAKATSITFVSFPTT